MYLIHFSVGVAVPFDKTILSKPQPQCKEIYLPRIELEAIQYSFKQSYLTNSISNIFGYCNYQLIHCIPKN